jgi:hypothetical protein
MKTPSRTCLRITAYHMVDASRVPWIGCHGGGGAVSSSAIPAAIS